MDLNGKKIILGSASPRRRELLEALDVEFTVDSDTSFHEFVDKSVAPEELPIEMSRGKSLGFHRPLEEDEILITSDTIVLCDGEIMGKPGSAEDGRRMLRKLSGRGHQVITAVTLRDVRHCESFSDRAYVFFDELTEEEIDYYMGRYSPLDKAGAYGIQEWIGCAAISRIEGSFYTIMGFPSHLVYRELLRFSRH